MRGDARDCEVKRINRRQSQDTDYRRGMHSGRGKVPSLGNYHLLVSLALLEEGAEMGRVGVGI